MNTINVTNVKIAVMMVGMADHPSTEPTVRPATPGRTVPDSLESSAVRRDADGPVASTRQRRQGVRPRPARWAASRWADRQLRRADRAHREAADRAVKRAILTPPAVKSTPVGEVAAKASTGQATTRSGRLGVAVLLTAVAVLLMVVITAPIALSSQDLIEWAGAWTGLGLNKPWDVVVFVALDAAAAVCVLLTVYCAWRGEPAGVFGLLVWAFAATSAIANYRHGSRDYAPADAWWFFPAMALAGPGLLEAVTRRVRQWVQRNGNRRGHRMPSFGWRRWMPGVGSWRDTYGAYRTANLMGIETVDAAVAAYHWLCPDGSLRVARALREVGTSRLSPPHPSAQVVQPPTPEPSAPVHPVRPAAQADARPRKTRKATPAVPARPTMVWSPTVAADVQTLRIRYSGRIPGRNEVCRDLNWDRDKASKARNALMATADTEKEESREPIHRAG